ncbi:MAG: hypothetical protein JHD16_10175, partial [Solirubrobacteraceae bacterium]|nr:hypothetical protein [Solirubrobacteraceae bacterium]
MVLPDLDRIGGLRWTQRTGGDLTPRERRRLLGAIAQSHTENLLTRLWLATGRVPERAAGLSLADFQPPDSAFATTVLDACAEQAPAWQAHAYRTWIFGSALSIVDDVSLEPELFLAAALLHDHGIEEAVPGEDFTLRAAERARQCADGSHLAPDAVIAIQDAITVHLTPGLKVARDGALGTYVQKGAFMDLTGSRGGDVLSTLRREAAAAHPRDSAVEIATLKAQRRANPAGRVAFACRCGFLLGVRISPLRGD